MNSTMFVALNGVGTALYDPRPAVAEFLRKKEKCYREPDLTLYSDRDFVRKFFRKDGGEFMDILALINSATNVLLYCSMSRQFRSTFVEVFCPRLFNEWNQITHPATSDKSEKTQLSQA